MTGERNVAAGVERDETTDDEDARVRVGEPAPVATLVVEVTGADETTDVRRRSESSGRDGAKTRQKTMIDAVS